MRRSSISGITPIIPGRRDRKRMIQCHRRRYRERWPFKATFNRLTDFRRLSPRDDKLARDHASAVALAAIAAFR